MPRSTSKAAVTESIDKAQHAEALSKALMVPSVPHAVVVQTYMRGVAGIDVDQEAVRNALRDEARAVVSGDLQSAERMLTAQANSLNAVCIDLMLRANANLGEYMSVAETYLKLALKAQNQCRATLETLATIKNPPIVYARQANFAAGPQQVNNGVPAHAGKNGTPPNELLEENHDKGERLDGGPPGKAIGSDPAMAAVGAINRGAKR